MGTGPNSERVIAVALPVDLYDAIMRAATAVQQRPSKFLRELLSDKFCIPLVVTKIGRPPKTDAMRKVEAECAPVRKGTPEAEYRVQDCKRRGFSKHGTAALTKLPYAEVERLWALSPKPEEKAA